MNYDCHSHLHILVSIAKVFAEPVEACCQPFIWDMNDMMHSHAVIFIIAIFTNHCQQLWLKWKEPCLAPSGRWGMLLQGLPEVTVQPSGGLVGLNQQNVYEGGAHLTAPLCHSPRTATHFLSMRWHIKDNSISFCVSSACIIWNPSRHEYSYWMCLYLKRAQLSQTDQLHSPFHAHSCMEGQIALFHLHFLLISLD